ncbi:ATP-binding protein [Rheinheimera salexigens]|uniref:histidine kinase n=1 Tax=Rheinheimera salexigens TaxID=1628148 RepID=A0A1E7Q4F8_9GAMM|nr:ATP-binding protein [Rheinheimera salexigens]OEY69082.1 histidine kinase [Rheinheimera salexigens]
MRHKSLSRKLLIQVLSVYFILTFLVTLSQIYAEYSNAKNQIKGELEIFQQTIKANLSRAIWQLDPERINAISDRVLALPVIDGIIIRDEYAKVIWQSLQQNSIETILSDHLIRQKTQLTELPTGVFGYSFPLMFEYADRTTQVGDVTLLSHRSIVIERIKTSIYTLITNVFIKSAFLIILFLLAFRKQLSQPLNQLTQQIKNLKFDQLQDAKITVSQPQTNELTVMAVAFNRLIERVQDAKQQLESTQKQLLIVNNKLDQQNLMLEQDVARKTSGLSQAMIDLQHQKQKLETKQQTLVSEIERRRETELSLLSKQAELEATVNDLKQTQERLLQSEKLAALGGLVAGITHEVNTPVGIGVTANSFLSDKITVLNQAFTAKTLTSSQLATFIEEANQSTDLIQSNLSRAAELIASFKQIAVDQTSNATRSINLAHYIDEIIRSLKPNLKQNKHHVEVNCPDNIVLDCPAGAISQIITNLIMNSLLHGFDNITEGLIRITVVEQDNNIDIKFSDNGKGLASEQLVKLFDPFFTTKRNLGGSGLGAHITYNLVRQTLHGSIHASSELGQGVHYHIRFPKKPINAT